MTDLQSQIYEELRGARKLPDGLTSGSIAALPYVCAVLGNGDPAAAYSTLVTSIRQHEMDAVTWAGLASLGLDPSTGRGSVLQRLEKIAAETHVDQRTARRWADEGLVRVARLIATNWATAVPRLTVSLKLQDTVVIATVLLERPERITTRPLIIRIQHDSGADWDEVPTNTQRPDSHQRPNWCTEVLDKILFLDSTVSPRMSIHWLGEAWPQFVVQTTPSSGTTLRTVTWTLGNQILIDVLPPNTTQSDSESAT